MWLNSSWSTRICVTRFEQRQWSFFSLVISGSCYIPLSTSLMGDHCRQTSLWRAQHNFFCSILQVFLNKVSNKQYLILQLESSIAEILLVKNTIFPNYVSNWCFSYRMKPFANLQLFLNVQKGPPAGFFSNNSQVISQLSMSTCEHSTMKITKRKLVGLRFSWMERGSCTPLVRNNNPRTCFDVFCQSLIVWCERDQTMEGCSLWK